jgi:hypothetical protein
MSACSRFLTMAPWSREKIGKAAPEIADHLMLVDNLKALQQAQKEMASALAVLDDRIRKIEAEIRAVKAEVKLDAIKETQQMLNAVQGAFHDKLVDLTVRVSHVEKDAKPSLISFTNPGISPPSDKPPA